MHWVFYFFAWSLGSVQVCKLKQCVLFFCTHVNNENPTFLPTVFTVSRFVTGWTVVESGKHIWLYAFATLHRLVSVSQKCTDLCTNNFEINLIGQLPVALEAGSVLSRVALWGWFEEQMLTQLPVQPQCNSKQNRLSLRAARRWPVVYAGPYDKTSPLAVSILFNENVLILFNFIIWIYINIWMQF